MRTLDPSQHVETPALCPHTDVDRVSVCCYAPESEFGPMRCSKCHDGTGFELICNECGVQVEEES